MMIHNNATNGKTFSFASEFNTSCLLNILNKINSLSIISDSKIEFSLYIKIANMMCRKLIIFKILITCSENCTEIAGGFE